MRSMTEQVLQVVCRSATLFCTCPEHVIRCFQDEAERRPQRRTCSVQKHNCSTGLKQ